MKKQYSKFKIVKTTKYGLIRKEYLPVPAVTWPPLLRSDATTRLNFECHIPPNCRIHGTHDCGKGDNHPWMVTIIETLTIPMISLILRESCLNHSSCVVYGYL